uniref:Uncharacterized protein n=1 Tax=Rhipicephalus microplus TaxID=6941 RepID=A0A6G5A288_RHIMP
MMCSKCDAGSPLVLITLAIISSVTTANYHLLIIANIFSTNLERTKYLPKSWLFLARTFLDYSGSPYRCLYFCRLYWTFYTNESVSC